MISLIRRLFKCNTDCYRSDFGPRTLNGIRRIYTYLMYRHQLTFYKQSFLKATGMEDRYESVLASTYKHKIAIL